MALMPSLLYSGLAQATCVEELDKLKAAAAEYKRIIGGQAVLPDEIKELIRARYKKGFDGWGDGPNGGWIYAKKCLETNWQRTLAAVKDGKGCVLSIKRFGGHCILGTYLRFLRSRNRLMGPIKCGTPNGRKLTGYAVLTLSSQRSRRKKPS